MRRLSFIKGLEDKTVAYKQNVRAFVSSVTVTRRCHKFDQVGHIARYIAALKLTQKCLVEEKALVKEKHQVGICCYFE